MSETDSPVTKSPRERRRRVRAAIAVALATVIVVAAMVGFRHLLSGRVLPLTGEQRPRAVRAVAAVQLVPGTSDSLQVDAGVVKQLGIKIAEARTAELADKAWIDLPSLVSNRFSRAY